MEPSSTLRSLATWLLSSLRYTCSLLGCLAICLPPIHVNEHEEAIETYNGASHDNAMLTVDSSNVADRVHYLESKHKVFLSHSGVQKDFVEQLCLDLERWDRYPFFDKLRSSLPIGEKFPRLIFDAIEQCHVGVVILSDDFFMRSKWPMLELNAMVKEFEKPNSSMKIMPVFYLISVKDLKDSNRYSRWTLQWEKWAFDDKEKCINVEEWKKALRVLGSINSFVANEGYGDVKLREEIVREVCRLVPRETRWDMSYIQGYSRCCKIIREKMDEIVESPRIRMVGLYGMGGIGKSTICKALCNDLSLEFHDNVCHLELGATKEIELLQKALKMLTNVRHDILDKLDAIEEGYAYLKRRMRSEPVFLALDNVQDNYSSLEAARTYMKASYGPKSVVLVTSRSLDVLKKLNLDETNCLEVPELEEEEAKSLFLDQVDVLCKNQVDEVLVKDCIERCHFLKGDGRSRHYHPLALKVLAQQLSSNATLWAAQLSKIDTFNQLGETEHPVFSIIRNSFSSLRRKHRCIFMDLALLMPDGYAWPVQWTRLDWLCMVYEESIEDMQEMLHVLKRKSLLEDLSEDFIKIGMHDLCREFAVVEIKGKDFRDQRWVYQVEEKKALGRTGPGRENVEWMCFLNWGWRSLNGLQLSNFPNVTAFKLEVEIRMKDRMLDLDLSGLKHIKSLDVWTPGLPVRAHGLSSLTNLGFLCWHKPGFSPCLDEIGRLTNLQYLKIEDCKAVQLLDITELKLLTLASFTKFPDLVTVEGLSSKLTNLRFLGITKCKCLQECPGLDELYSLEVLILNECGQLRELPCLGLLTNLMELSIDKCTSIKTVPGLSDLVDLEELRAEGCLELAVLPDLVKLTELQVLDIRQCPVQEARGLNGLISLTTLRASFGVVGEQPVFSQLSALKVLAIHGWNGPIWTSIRDLLMLEELELIDCNGENMVPDLQNLKRLKSVDFFNCEFKDLLGLSNLTALEDLKLDGCGKLKRLPEFEKLTKLSYLQIRECHDIRNWPSASDLCSLKRLSVDGFSLMKSLRDLETLRGLRNLELWGSGCENALSVITSLSHLERLWMVDVLAMEELDVSNSPQLIELWLVGCSALKRLTCNVTLIAFNELSVSSSESLVEIPDLSKFPHLELLSLKECRALRRLTCSRPLTALKEINLSGCDSLVERPDLSEIFPKLLSFSVDD